MHYYQFNIADYRKDTQHLTPIEHYIYRELMDWYYLDEAPIPLKTQSVTRRLRLVSENEQEVLNVLEEFFTKDAEGWVHGRIEQEINTYQRRADAARANGSKGGRPKKPRKTQPVNLANPEKPSQKLTNNHKPIIPPLPPKGVDADAWSEFEQHRKEIRKPLTDLARNKAANVLIGKTPQEQKAIVDNTIQNRWTGLFPAKLKQANGKDYDWSKNL